MELADKVDPAEVLAHLKQLGYRNITPPQLKEFIKDLKKLILYDQLSSSSSSASLTSLSSCATSDSETHSSSDSSYEDVSLQSQTLNSKCPFERSDQMGLRVFMKGKKSDKENKQGVSKNTPSLHSGIALRRSSASSSSISEKVPLRQNVPLRKGRTVSSSTDNLLGASKPKTSFIRPWQLQGVATGTGRTGSRDPVSLHQYYQTMWAKHKCPGEDSRSDLRWLIREKMLGQNPQLYSKTVPLKKNGRVTM